MVYLITSGAMSEAIDQVRSIVNTSTGKTGATIADFLAANNQVIYLHTRSAILPKNSSVELVQVDSINQLDQQLKSYLTKHLEITVIHAMAVSDFTVSGTIVVDELIDNILKMKADLSKDSLKQIIEKTTKQQSKLASNQKTMINLKQNPKVISNIKKYNSNAKLVGFKLLSNVQVDELISVARNQQLKNDCDIVVANRLEDLTNKHIAYLVLNDKMVIKCNDNQEIAKKIQELLGAK